MGRVRIEISVSLDGYAAGPDQSVEQPLGRGGERLHEWALALEAWRRAHGLEGGEVNASTPVMEDGIANVGATIMGRNMFGGGPGPWGAPPWNGWWGDDPPFHHPVFVLTHHPRERLELSGGTSFQFVTGGIETALAAAREAAGDGDVKIAGGAQTVRGYLAAGLADELTLHLVPVLLGGGSRLLGELDDIPGRLEPVLAAAAPGVTHLRYRVER
ncbi:MAG: dihydrofolate reductase family protein [Thermoleophilia bacterium]